MFMDKLTIGFICDILYVKGLLKHDEYETIMNAKSPMDLDDIIDRMLRGDFLVKRGETYH